MEGVRKSVDCQLISSLSEDAASIPDQASTISGSSAPEALLAWLPTTGPEVPCESLPIADAGYLNWITLTWKMENCRFIQ